MPRSFRRNMSEEPNGPGWEVVIVYDIHGNEVSAFDDALNVQFSSELPPVGAMVDYVHRSARAVGEEMQRAIAALETQNITFPPISHVEICFVKATEETLKILPRDDDTPVTQAVPTWQKVQLVSHAILCVPLSMNEIQETRPLTAIAPGQARVMEKNIFEVPTVYYTHYEVVVVSGFIHPWTTGVGPQIIFNFLDAVLPPIGCTGAIVPTAAYRNEIRSRVRLAFAHFRREKPNFPNVEPRIIEAGRVRITRGYNPFLTNRALLEISDTRILFDYREERGTD